MSLPMSGHAFEATRAYGLKLGALVKMPHLLRESSCRPRRVAMHIAAGVARVAVSRCSIYRSSSQARLVVAAIGWKDVGPRLDDEERVTSSKSQAMPPVSLLYTMKFIIKLYLPTPAYEYSLP